MKRSLTEAFSHSVLRIKRVRLVVLGFPVLSPKIFLSTIAAPSNPPLTTPRENGSRETQFDIASINLSGIAQSLISNCSQLIENKGGSLGLGNPSIKDLLLEISNVVPDHSRRFRRFSELKPEDVLELLLGFQSEGMEIGIESRKVDSLWKIFKWADERSTSFQHLPRSCKVMASMLIQVGLVRDVEFLLSRMENQGILLDSQEIHDNLIKRCICEAEVERAVSAYDDMRKRGLTPSLSCYCIFLDCLVRAKKIHLMFRVCVDILEMAAGFDDELKATFENIIRELCVHKKIQEARNLIKKSVPLGFEPSSEILYEIANGYCEKMEFDDLVSFFGEIGSSPDVLAGNRIIRSLCSRFGSEGANLFMQELKEIGFKPDEITFGVLIGWSCLEGKLKHSFLHFSELLSNCLKPDLHTYNALISRVFKEGMWTNAIDIFYEMKDNGRSPDLSTFRILLAGYCKARRFDEAKLIIREMEQCGLLQRSSLHDPLSDIFSILGFDPLDVRLKRDNRMGSFKTEFYDNLGNGLYLETNLDEYEKRVDQVLHNSMLPDFNTSIIKECGEGDWMAAFKMVEQMVRWGQELSPESFTALVRCHSASTSQTRSIIDLLKKRPNLVAQVDEHTLNFLLQTCSAKELLLDMNIIFNEMLQLGVKIEKETYTALIKSFCKIENWADVLRLWHIARKSGWIPGLEDCKYLLKCFCKRGEFKEVFVLLESMLCSYPNLRLGIVHLFMEKLCRSGSASIAHAMLNEFLSRGIPVNHRAYNHLLKCFCKEKNALQAFRFLDGILAMDFSPSSDVAVDLIRLLSRAGRFERAVVLKEMSASKQLKSSPTVYGALIEGLCKTGRVEEAFSQFQNMLMKGLAPDAKIYNLLVQGCCFVGNFRKVWMLFGFMMRKDLSLSISSYRTLIRLMCMEKRVCRAFSLKELMLEQDEIHDLIIYNILIFSLFISGNGSIVNKILDEMQARRLRLDEVTYNFLVYGFSASKDVPRSLHYISCMISQGIKPRNLTFTALIDCLCENREVGKAAELSLEMELKGWTHGSTVQNSIAESLVLNKKLQEAESFLKRMAEKCLVPSNINYNNLIRHFCRQGKLSMAVELLNTMLKKGNTPASSSYDFVVQSYCLRNTLDQALDFHTEMLDRGLKPAIKTTEELIFSFCRNGKTGEAEKLLIGMVAAGEVPSKQMYSSVINRYRSENNLKKASEIMQALQKCGHEPDFETHWSLVSNLSNSANKNSPGFLSRLLCRSGFSPEQDTKLHRHSLEMLLYVRRDVLQAESNQQWIKNAENHLV